MGIFYHYAKKVSLQQHPGNIHTYMNGVEVRKHSFTKIKKMFNPLSQLFLIWETISPVYTAITLYWHVFSYKHFCF